MQYRPEIDGLRAIAVIPVVFFHAGYSLFQGGYVGVDIFFVISGYLITSIILKELKENKFSLIDFYERRARRILPAFFFVIFLTTCAAWKYLLPDDLKVFAQGVAASAAFAANIYFYLKSNNYFGLQAEENPILHMWSLAVEEQFYLFFPLLCLIIWKPGKKSLFYILSIGCLFSFIAAQLLVTSNPSAAFFLLPTRAWELILGALIALSSKKIKQPQSLLLNDLAGMAGLGLIACSIYFFDHQTPFPSYWTLLPTLGTALIIVYTHQDTRLGQLLSHRVCVGIGRISFSLYLWHQPLFAFNRLLNANHPSASSFFYLFLLSLVLAYFTWRYIETPFRHKQRFSRRWILTAALLGNLGFIVFGIQGHLNSGYPERDPLYNRLVSNVGLSLQCNGNHSLTPACSYGHQPELAFLGNSYAMHLIPGFQSAFPDQSFVQLTLDSCEPHRNDTRAQAGKAQCAVFHEQALKTIRETPSLNKVVISSPFKDITDPESLTAFETTLQQLQSAGKTILIVGPTPANGTHFGKCFVQHSPIFSNCHFARATLQPDYFETIQTLKHVADKHHIGFIDLTDIICSSDTCKTSQENLLIYRDPGHLSIEGSRYIIQTLKPHITQKFSPQKD